MSENPHSADFQQYIHYLQAAIVAVGITIHVQTLYKLLVRQPGGPKPFYVLTMLGSVHRSVFDFLQDKEKCGGD